VILFVDEVHTLVGAGATSGAMDASNMLKPALARGTLHFVGATTLDEYRKHIEKDGALARRFQTVYVREVRTRSCVADRVFLLLFLPCGASVSTANHIDTICFPWFHRIQPTVEDTVSILRGLKEKYELHHGVQIMVRVGPLLSLPLVGVVSRCRHPLNGTCLVRS